MHMRNKFVVLCILFALAATSCYANKRDSLPSPLTQFRMAAFAGKDNGIEDYLQYGIHIGSDLNLTTKWLSGRDHSKTHLSAMFGFYARGGYKYIFGETGLEYIFHKCHCEAWSAEGAWAGEETVEFRYLQIPVKVVGQIKAGEICAFLPYAGIVYKPLIHCSKNDLNYEKNTLTRHQCQVTAGLDFRIKFFIVGVGYKYNLKPSFSDRSSVHRQYLTITLGVQL